MDQDREITAVFLPQYRLVVEFEPPGAEASIALAPAGPYDENTTVTLLATGHDGWTFSHWEGAVNDANSPQTTLLIGSADATVIAVFAPPIRVTATASPSVGGTIATMTRVAYIRGLNPPWGSATNQEAMDLAFGAGNWDDLRMADGVAPFLPQAGYGFIFLEGSHYTADELNAYLQTYGDEIEDFVSRGVRLLLNSAPNQGGNIDFGFEGTSLLYGNNASSTATAVDASHPIFQGPHTPVTTSYSGSSYSHATVSGDLTPILTGPSGTILGERDFGSGKVLFGGMTTTNFHNPQPQALYLRANMLDYLADGTLGQVSVVATAAEGYSFSHWTDNGAWVSASPAYAFTPTGVHELVASFTADVQYYNMNVTPHPATGGTVAGGGTYGAGAAVSLSATPQAGHQFAGWLENGLLVSTANPYEFAAMGNRDLVADFPWFLPAGEPASLTTPTGRVRLLLPAGATLHACRVWIKPLPLAPTPAGYRNLGTLHTMQFTTPDRTVSGVTFQVPGNLVWQYHDFERMGLGRDAPLRIFFQHPGAGLWVPLRSSLAEEDTTVTATVGHATDFALMAEMAPMNRPVIDPVPAMVGSSALWISGQVTAGTSATLYLNDEPQTLTVGTDGRFEVPLVLQTGPNHFFVVEEEDGETLASYEERVVSMGQIFSDIAGHWAKDYILQLAAGEITTGYPGATPDAPRWFGPQEVITRGEFTTFLMRALNRKGSTDPVAFTDQASIPAWMMEYLEAGMEISAVTGYPDGSFRPHEPITRSEIAVMLARALVWADVNRPPASALSFVDTEAIPDWALEAVQVASQDIITGYPDGSFLPRALATRAESAAMLVRLLMLL